MTFVVADTSVWIDFINGQNTSRVALLRSYLSAAHPVALTDIVLCEILQGLRDDRVTRVDDSLSALPVLELNGAVDCRSAAHLYRSARKNGTPIRRTTDCLIAATCIREDAILLHDDADFDRLAAVSDLRTVRPVR